MTGQEKARPIQASPGQKRSRTDAEGKGNATEQCTEGCKHKESNIGHNMLGRKGKARAGPVQRQTKTGA